MRECTLAQLSDFDYDLPKTQIAQFALPKRSSARLLVLDRRRGTREHRSFRDIGDFFERGHVLVLNDTKVLPARLFARRKTGARVEMLVLRFPKVNGYKRSMTRTGHSQRHRHCETADQSEVEAISELRLLRQHSGFLPRNDGLVPNICQVLIKPSGRIRKDEELILHDANEVIVRVLDEADHSTGIRHVEFQTGEKVESLLNRIGRIPLPPYIDREDSVIDRELYQTVFAAKPGAVASPTAGLHFDEDLLRSLKAKGVEMVYVTLHVSYGTFQPVQSEDLAQHQMYVEYYEVSDEAAEQINLAKMKGRSIVACGTTVVRALESAATESVPPEVRATRGETSLFIYPPYQFRIPDRLITNFHLPKSTLLMLTSAFAGHDLLMRAYREAIAKKYRFYSYGDAMLIL